METYTKDGKFVLIDNCNRFIYEVFVYVSYDNYCCLARTEMFSCDKEIEGVIERYKISKHIEVECEMYSAPLRWLLDNDYQVYVKPEKKKRIRKIKKNE